MRATIRLLLRWIAYLGWHKLGKSSRRPEFGMTPDPGPAVEGYVERNFEDPIPNSREVDVYIAELERDFNKDEE